MSKSTRQDRSLQLSQNFLTCAKTLNRLLRLTDITRSDHIVEIGAGKGHITKTLINNSKVVTAVELDSNLYAALAEKLKDVHNVKLLNMDFLKMRLPLNEPYKVFSNIPFSRTSDIISKLLYAPNPPESSWLIVEKGAAKRFAGMPYDNVKSLSLKPFYDLHIVYHFRKEDFHPMPSVDTVMLQIKRKTVPDLDYELRHSFKRFITDANNRGLYSMFTKKQVSTALRMSNLPQIEQSGMILYVQWLCLFRCLTNN